MHFFKPSIGPEDIMMTSLTSSTLYTVFFPNTNTHVLSSLAILSFKQIPRSLPFTPIIVMLLPYI